MCEYFASTHPTGPLSQERKRTARVLTRMEHIIVAPDPDPEPELELNSHNCHISLSDDQEQTQFTGSQ
jgi:hypothetical protein